MSAPPRCFVPGPLQAAGRIALPARVAHHLRTVLRLRPGAALQLFDGRGGQWHARLADGDHAELDRFEPDDRASPLAVTLVQALVATDKMDWIIEKATELGVARIAVVPAARSAVRLADDRRERRLAHWHEVIAAACAQCGRNRLPRLSWHRSLAEAVTGAPGADPPLASDHALRVLLVPGAARSLAALTAPGIRHAAVAVGPEGDWADDERASAQAAGWQAASLGPRVLRTETAGLAALAVLQTLSGDLGATVPPVAPPDSGYA
jgi:16S rRNA (uracil1498-N3)-methyltransferase